MANLKKGIKDHLKEAESLKREVSNFKKEIKMLEDHMEEAEILR